MPLPIPTQVTYPKCHVVLPLVARRGHLIRYIIIGQRKRASDSCFLLGFSCVNGISALNLRLGKQAFDAGK
ncbi:hypothetical protein HYQ46_007495 [Verticillium longisporum]|nr:hypothetical protein HYQ46_007495 [Verticillium longisporum]